MEKTDIDNQIQRCVGSYKPARNSLIQVHEHKAELNLNKVQNSEIDEEVCH